MIFIRYHIQSGSNGFGMVLCRPSFITFPLYFTFSVRIGTVNSREKSSHHLTVHFVLFDEGLENVKKDFTTLYKIILTFNKPIRDSNIWLILLDRYTQGFACNDFDYNEHLATKSIKINDSNVKMFAYNKYPSCIFLLASFYLKELGKLGM